MAGTATKQAGESHGGAFTVCHSYEALYHLVTREAGVSLGTELSTLLHALQCGLGKESQGKSLSSNTEQGALLEYRKQHHV